MSQGEDVPDSETEVLTEPDDGARSAVAPNTHSLALDEDFEGRWRALAETPPERAVEWVVDAYGDRPRLLRETLAMFLAQRLGYGRLLRRPEELQRDPLWDLLRAETFAKLDSPGRKALLQIAESTRAGRPGFALPAALANIALWRNGAGDQARTRLQSSALPDDPSWLYKLVGALIDLDDDGLTGRSLHALARIQLAGDFWEPAALIAGLYLVHEFAPTWVGSPVMHLVAACDRAAEERPRAMRPWIDLLADAAVGGHLHESWLEKPVRAAIRLSVDCPERERRLRDWHDRRPYDADHARLEALYGYHLDRLGGPPGPLRGHAERIIEQEVERSLVHNPVRAQRLLELVVIRRYGPRVGTRASRLRRALERLADQPRLGRAEKLLVRLYVRNFHIEPHAVRTVRRLAERVDWASVTSESQSVDPLETYLMVGDYERAFEKLTYSYEGVDLEHADMNAASRLKFFVRKRLDPNIVSRQVRRLWRPLEWISRQVMRIEAVSRAVDGALGIFERRIARLDLADEIVTEYNEAGIDIDSFDQIARLNMGQIDLLMRRRKSTRLMVGATAGAVSGGLAPLSWAPLTLADAPVLLALTADICSRFCWYYGFDPREHPELPTQIMAAALAGPSTDTHKLTHLRRNLRSHALRKSIVVGALAHGAVTQLAKRALQWLFKDRERSEADASPRPVARGGASHSTSPPSTRTLPVLGGLLGASLNTAMLYDVCEAAQAVLT
ncbi:MAG: hypothetical protein ACOCV2_02525, partial [Persicimonas sp.]